MQVQKARQGYKLARSLHGKYEEIPENWDMKKLSELVTDSISYGVLVPDYDPNGVPMIRSGELDTPRGIDRNIIMISKSLEEKYKKTRLSGGELLVSLVGYTGQVTLVSDFYSGYNVSRAIGVIRLKKEFDKKFYYYALKSDSSQKKILNESIGSAQPVINLENLRKLLIIVPPPKEQQKIASVLSNVDSLINQTQNIVEQTIQLKKGLMQKLLTRGIGHTKFKKTHLGEIPEDWEIETLEKYVNILSGEYFEYSEFAESGIRVLKIDNVMYGEINWETRTFLPDKYLTTHSDIVLIEGDIVLALNRPITNSQIKIARLTEDDSPSILYQRVGKFRFLNENIDRDFFYAFLNSPIFKKTLAKILIGSDQPYVRTTELLKQHFALPKEKLEQQQIATILSNVNLQLQKQQEYKSQLETLKKGLMQKLLTGQIRVKV